MKMNHESYLQIALDAARGSVEEGGGPFGAVVVKDGKVIAKAANRVVPDADPTAHAEILAIREAARILGSYNLSGCTLYASAEPCPMCMGAIYWSCIDRMYYACSVEETTRAGFDDQWMYHEFTLPAGKRSVAAVQIQLESRLEPFERWEKLPRKDDYSIKSSK